MKLLIDNALSPRVSEGLQKIGYDAEHVRDHGLGSATDTNVLEFARSEKLVLVSADTDFSSLLMESRLKSPSIILFRGQTVRNPDKQVQLLKNNLEKIVDDLETGCIAIIEPTRLRIKELPLLGE